VRPAALLACAAAALCLSLPAAAGATPGQRTMVEDTAVLFLRGPEARAAALDEMRALGTDIVKLRVQWGLLAPDPTNETRPEFDAADPAAYPPGAWDVLDEIVRQVTVRGMRPFLMLSPPGPEWATDRGEQAGHPGVLNPDPREFGAFARALGTRYSGSYLGLPRVSMWSLWNEPNHPQFLQPLGRRRVPVAAHIYRNLYVEAQRGLAETGHARDTVLFGEILPIGQRRIGPLNTIRPILFLREMFCLDSRYRPYRGSAARARGCSPFPRIVTSGFAYHAYTRPTGPRTVPPHPDDATIGQIGRIERALDLIARTGRVRRRLPIYNTEFGLQSDPPDCVGFGAPLDLQAEYINEAELMSFRSRRVRTYSNYLLIDDPVLLEHPPGSNARYGLFQTGLKFGVNALRCESPTIRFEYGEEKPAYAAFRTPLYVTRTGRRAVEVFGRARPMGRTPVRIEILRGSRVVRRVTARGYFRTRIRANPGGTWRLRWSRDGTVFESRAAKARRP